MTTDAKKYHASLSAQFARANQLLAQPELTASEKKEVARILALVTSPEVKKATSALGLSGELLAVPELKIDHLGTLFNHPDLILSVLKLGFNLTPLLFEAAATGRADIIKTFAKDFSIQDKNGNTLATCAAAAGHDNVITALAAIGFNLGTLDGNGYTAATKAAETGRANIITTLGKIGIDLDRTDAYGYSPATRAAQNGHANVITALGKKKADLNAIDKDGYTPATRAAALGHANVITALAPYADLNARDKHDTPATKAAHKGYDDVMLALINAGADLSAINGSGYNPATLAATMGHANIIDILAASHIDLNCPDGEGYTPARCAVKACQTQVLLSLDKAGVKIDWDELYRFLPPEYPERGWSEPWPERDPAREETKNLLHEISQRNAFQAGMAVLAL